VTLLKLSIFFELRLLVYYRHTFLVKRHTFVTSINLLEKFFTRTACSALSGKNSVDIIRPLFTIKILLNPLCLFFFLLLDSLLSGFMLSCFGNYLIDLIFIRFILMLLYKIFCPTKKLNVCLLGFLGHEAFSLHPFTFLWFSLFVFSSFDFKLK